MPTIVTVNVSLTIASAPETLQETGAFISQGGTNTSPGTASLLTQLSDLTPLLNGAKSLSAITWTTNVATATTTSPHGIAIGDTLELTITGASPTGFNGTFLATITGTSAFTYPLLSNPGGSSSTGSYTPEDVSELVAMATTFFAQGSTQSVYVLELGPGNPNDGVTALTAYLTANPNTAYVAGALGYYYGYLVPRTWDGNTNFIALVATFNATTAKTYFWVTTTLATYGLYPVTDKCLVLLVESPLMGAYPANAFTALTAASLVVTATTTTAHGVAVGEWFTVAGCLPVAYNGTFQAQVGTTGSTLIYNALTAPGAETALGTLQASYFANAAIPATEFSLAAPFYNALNNNPSATNKVTPFAFEFLFGVTPFPTRGNGAITTVLQKANVNYVGTGSEGGISNTILFWGTTLDGNDYNNWWYSIDWVQINADLNVANAVINGSNNKTNPLYYNQPGIDRLQAVVAATIATGVSSGLVLGPPVQTALDVNTLNDNIELGAYAGKTVVNAIPFLDYTAANPSDYKDRKYSGITIVYVTQNGFIAIVLNVNVTQFVNQ